MTEKKKAEKRKEQAETWINKLVDECLHQMYQQQAKLIEEVQKFALANQNAERASTFANVEIPQDTNETWKVLVEVVSRHKRTDMSGFNHDVQVPEQRDKRTDQEVEGNSKKPVLNRYSQKEEVDKQKLMDFLQNDSHVLHWLSQQPISLQERIQVLHMVSSYRDLTIYVLEMQHRNQTKSKTQYKKKVDVQKVEESIKAFKEAVKKQNDVEIQITCAQLSQECAHESQRLRDRLQRELNQVTKNPTQSKALDLRFHYIQGAGMSHYLRRQFAPADGWRNAPYEDIERTFHYNHMPHVPEHIMLNVMQHMKEYTYINAHTVLQMAQAIQEDKESQINYIQHFLDCLPVFAYGPHRHRQVVHSQRKRKLTGEVIKLWIMDGTKASDLLRIPVSIASDGMPMDEGRRHYKDDLEKHMNFSEEEVPPIQDEIYSTFSVMQHFIQIKYAPIQ